jgi:hypothetical protein
MARNGLGAPINCRIKTSGAPRAYLAYVDVVVVLTDIPDSPKPADYLKKNEKT